MHALEHATVHPCTVAALCPMPPTTSALPRTPADAPRRPLHATPLSPSSLSLLLAPSARAPTARELQWTSSHARRPGTPPLSLSLTLGPACRHRLPPRVRAGLRRPARNPLGILLLEAIPAKSELPTRFSGSPLPILALIPSLSLVFLCLNTETDRYRSTAIESISATGAPSPL